MESIANSAEALVAAAAKGENLQTRLAQIYPVMAELERQVRTRGIEVRCRVQTDEAEGRDNFAYRRPARPDAG